MADGKQSRDMPGSVHGVNDSLPSSQRPSEGRSLPSPTQKTLSAHLALPRALYGSRIVPSDAGWCDKRVFLLRRGLGLSIRDFATVVGVSSSLVAKWEAGGKIAPAYVRVLETLNRRGRPQISRTDSIKQLLQSSVRGGNPLRAFLMLTGMED